MSGCKASLATHLSCSITCTLQLWMVKCFTMRFHRCSFLLGVAPLRSLAQIAVLQCLARVAELYLLSNWLGL